MNTRNLVVAWLGYAGTFSRLSHGNVSARPGGASAELRSRASD